LDHAQRDAFVTQSHDAERGGRRETHEVSRVDLYLHPAVFVGQDRVAFNQRIIQARGLPVLVAVAFKARLPGDQTDTHDPIFDVVIIGFVVIVEGASGGCD